MDEIKRILELYNKLMPDTAYVKKNEPKYSDAVKAIEDIKNYILSIEDSATFKVERDDLAGTSLYLRVNCGLLSLTEVDAFCDAIKKANTIDVLPLADGTLSITFGFEDTYIPYDPKE